MSYELTAINNVTRSTGTCTFHIIGIWPWTNVPAILHMFAYCTATVIYIYTPYYSINRYRTTNCNLYLACYCNICISIICISPSNVKYMSHVKITRFALVGEVCQYIYATSTYWLQLCDQEHCTQMMPMTLKTLVMTIMPMSPAKPSCISWVSHWLHQPKIQGIWQIIQLPLI